MKLLLMRHVMAESMEESGVEYDAMRPISERGRRHCHELAKSLVDLGIEPQSAICSPFCRAVETAEEMASISPFPYTTSSLIAPGAGVDELLKALANNCDTCDDWVLAVLHEPDVSYLLGKILFDGKLPFDLEVLPGNLYALETEIIDQRVAANVVVSLSPVRLERSRAKLSYSS